MNTSFAKITGPFPLNSDFCGSTSELTRAGACFECVSDVRTGHAMREEIESVSSDQIEPGWAFDYLKMR